MRRAKERGLSGTPHRPSSVSTWLGFKVRVRARVRARVRVRVRVGVQP